MASPESSALSPILNTAGVTRSSALIVHAGISTLSRAGFRAEALVEALLEHVENGTLLMPAMTWRTITPQFPAWDELATPSHTGVLGEVFRTRYATGRSIHPTHSVAAAGREAALLLSRHHLDETPVSANSPYGLLRDYDTHVLLLGVGLESCTAIHWPEEQIAPDLYLRPQETAETYPCRDRHGTIHSVKTRRHWRLDRDYSKFAAPLSVKDQLFEGEIEGCGYQILAMRDLLREVTSTLIRDPRGTLRNSITAAVNE
jgi:aminoglycoside 3-N-acetyltransferase